MMAWTVNSPLEKEVIKGDEGDGGECGLQVMREVMGVTVLTDTLERAARRR